VGGERVEAHTGMVCIGKEPCMNAGSLICNNACPRGWESGDVRMGGGRCDAPPPALPAAAPGKGGLGGAGWTPPAGAGSGCGGSGPTGAVPPDPPDNTQKGGDGQDGRGCTPDKSHENVGINPLYCCSRLDLRSTPGKITCGVS